MSKGDDTCGFIPARFWQTMSRAEFEKFAVEQGGVLNAEQCARLWRMEDRQGTPPQRLEVLLRREDVEKRWPKPRR